MRKPLSHYKMVYLDAGDTLLTIPAARLILQQYLAVRSMHREEEHIDELFTEAFRLFYYGKQLDPFEVCTPESDRAFWVNLYKYVLEKLGAHEEWSEGQIHEVCHELYDIYTAPEHYQLFEDVYIGDHERNDIWAPNQVGIDAVKIIRYDYHSGEGIHTLRELFEQ